MHVDTDVVSTGSHSVGDAILERNVGQVLTRTYPGYIWFVETHPDGGVVYVRCMNLSGRWGFVLHINKIDNDYKAVKNAGGEILERYRVSRVKKNSDEVMSANRDYAGNRKFDAG